MDFSTLHVIDVIPFLVLWGIALHQWRRQYISPIPRVARHAADTLSATPLVSVIVPARNEDAHIERCIRSLLAQDYPRLEVIAVDDRSEDATGAILDHLAQTDDRLTVIHGAPLPPGWMGKAHAIVQGYRAAKGGWLLFTDADIEHAPWLLSGVMARMLSSTASFATAWARLRHASLGVYLANLAVFTYLLLVTDQRRFLNPKSRQSLVYGQFVIFARDAYEAVGTHAAVRGYSSTDTSLGYLAKLQGWMPLLFDARDSLETTMYRTFQEAFQGWTRSLVNGFWSAFGRGWGSVVLLITLVTMWWLWVTPWLAIVRGLVSGNGLTLAVGGLGALAGLVILRLLRGAWLSAARDLLAMPAACLLFAMMGLVGLVRAWWRGGTVWKGRVVQTAERLPPWQPQPPRLRQRR